MKPILSILFAAVAISCAAQSNTFVRGTLDIRYGSRLNPGAADVYTLSLNVDNSVVFRGQITNTPIVSTTSLLGETRVVRPALLNYQLVCAVVNPRNPEQTLDVGRLYGSVPISAAGVYNYGAGTLKVGVNAIGRAQAFESKYQGTASGKPLLKLSGGIVDRARKEALSIQKKVQGRTVSLVVTNYDKMIFAAHKMAAGPVQYYPEATVNGGMLYDGDRYAWYFQDVVIVYASEGMQKMDRLTGNIRWVEQPKKGSLRDGEYQFDVRLNEPPPDASAVFSGAANEDAFFQTDNTIAALMGAMKYRDSFTGDKVTQSSVTIELSGNKLTRLQTMNVTKLILLSAIVPLNAE